MTREESIKGVEFMAQAVRAARTSAAIGMGTPGEAYRRDLLSKAMRESQKTEYAAITAGHICGAIGLFCESPLRVPLKQYGRDGWFCCDKCHRDAVRETYNSGDDQGEAQAVADAHEDGKFTLAENER